MNSIKIGFDGLYFDQNPSGVGKFLLNILRALLLGIPKAEVIVYSNKSIFLPQDIKERVAVKFDQSTKFLKPTVWLKCAAGFTMRKDDLNFYISGIGLLPNLSSKTKTVTIVHDLNYKIVPLTMGRFHYLSHFLFLKRDVLNSNFVITNSNGTAKKIEIYFGKKVNLILHPPISSSFTKYKDLEVNSILEKFNINFPYFLSVGNLEPRKNLEKTITVFNRMKAKGLLKNYKLLLVGSNGWGNVGNTLLTKSNKDILKLGYVSDEDLPYLYNGASIFLFPSIYEGFGIPVREAIYCGVPVITSNIEELKESGENSAIYINPENLDEYETAIIDILDSVRPIIKENTSNHTSFDKLFEFINSN